MIEEIEIDFLSEKFCFENPNGSVIIGEAETSGGQVLTIKGEADSGEFIADQKYLLYGEYSIYKNKYNGRDEKQFHFQSFVTTDPVGRRGVIAYMLQAGKGSRIGPVTAQKIYDKYGEDSIRKIREEPSAISELTKVTPELIGLASQWLVERKKTEKETIRLTGLLHGRGFPKGLVKRAIQVLGNTAEAQVRKDPYLLLRFPGCGFKRCDQMYLDLELRPNRIKRQALLAWYTVASESSGNTWHPVSFVVNGINRLMGDKSRPKKAIQFAKAIGRVDPNRHGALTTSREENGVIVESGGNVWIAESRKAKNESTIARVISEAMTERENWPVLDQITDLTDHQKSELTKALSGSISILGGSPGTGKSFSAAKLIQLIGHEIGFDEIAVAAPTGKAAVRISELMQENEIPLKAFTWHRHLGVSEVDALTGNWSFTRGNKNPFEKKVIIGDESSMIDSDLMSSILKARAAGTQILFLGDINQLPPVGHGAPLRDFIAAGLPYGELTQIMRNSGGIVEACAAIRDGEQWAAGDNLVIDQQPDQIESIFDHLSDAKNQGLDPVWDCQIVVAVNEKSPLSRTKLNAILQNELNPDLKASPNPKSKKEFFRVGDKIVCTKNGRYPFATKQRKKDGEEIEAYIANGELAKVISVEPGFYVIDVSTHKDLVKIPRGKTNGESSGCNFDLGYALSVHKSQGSEWPVVIVVIDDYPGAKMVCDRSWIYTAISRAKQKCVLIGRKTTADSFCRRLSITGRKTFLKELILLNNAKMELVSL